MQSLLKELLHEGKRRKKIRKDAGEAEAEVPFNAKNNLAAKHSVNKTGAGAHEAKHGSKASRNRQNRNWKKEASRSYE